MPAAISMLGIKTLDEMHAWVSYKITTKLSQQQNSGNKEKSMILNSVLTKNLKLTEKEKRTQTRKLKRFLTKSKGCRAEEICHWSTM